MNNQKKTERKQFDEVMVPCYSPMPMIPEYGKGARLWDQEGREYIDFAGGIAVSCLGHAHPSLVNALKVQAEKLWHLSNVMTNAPALRLAKKLTQSCFAERVFFCNSGAEANEAALKLARRRAFDIYAEEKSEIIAFHQGFHGRTFFTVTAGGQPAYSDGFGPKPGDITHLPYNDLPAFEACISDKTCAVIVEPVQGEGGVILADDAFLQGLRALCNKHHALLIFDEVQTGVGRTGSFYAYQQTSVIPDILTSAKALGGGFPIGAMLTTRLFASHMKVGTHGSTYGGNPLACAVGLAVVELVNQGKLLEGVKEREVWFHQALDALNAKYNVFQAIRSKGLLIGAEFNDTYTGRAREFLSLAGEEGLLVLAAGANVIRITPSLLITKEEFDEGVIRFSRALARLQKA